MQVLGEIPQAVSGEAFKRAKHIQDEDMMDDVLFDSLLQAAQDVVETACNRPLSPREVVFDFRFHGSATRWWFPCCPVASVSKVEWFVGGVGYELPADAWRLERQHSEPQMVFSGVSIPASAEVRVEAIVGANAPLLRLEQAVILMAGDWFEAGIDPEKSDYTKVSFGCRALIKQGKYNRPCEWTAH